MNLHLRSSFCMLQLFYLYFYLFLSLCRAIPYVRCLTSNAHLKTRSSFVSMRPLPREGAGHSTIAANAKVETCSGSKHLGQDRSLVPTPMERPV